MVVVNIFHWVKPDDRILRGLRGHLLRVITEFLGVSEENINIFFITGHYLDHRQADFVIEILTNRIGSANNGVRILSEAIRTDVSKILEGFSFDVITKQAGIQRVTRK